MKVSQNPGCGPPETEDVLKSNFTDAPIPDYMQQKEAEKQKLYASGVPMIPDMSVLQWLFVHFLRRARHADHLGSGDGGHRERRPGQFLQGFPDLDRISGILLMIRKDRKLWSVILLS